MRTIHFDLTADDATCQYGFAGFEGEHNATLLSVRLPERMRGKTGAEYRFLFETAKGEAVFSMPVTLSEEGSVSVVLTRPLMFPPSLKAYVGCFVQEETETVLIAKTGEMILGVQSSLDNAQEEMPLAGGGVPGLVIDDALNAESENPVQNKALFAALEKKLEREDLPVDAKLDEESENPVQNRVLVRALDEKLDREDYKVDSALNASSSNPVMNYIVYAALREKLDRKSYTVDTQFDVYSQNPLQNKIIAQNVANAVTATVSGNPVFISDLSPVEHEIYVVAQGETPKQVTIDFSYEENGNYTGLHVVTDENGVLNLWTRPLSKFKIAKISCSSDVVLHVTYNRDLNRVLEKKLEREDLPVDAKLDAESENPVQNKILFTELEKKLEREDLPVDAELDAQSENPVQNKAISNLVANALKKEVQGNPVALRNVSPIPHKISVKIENETRNYVPAQFIAYVTQDLSEYQFERGFGNYTVETVETMESDGQMKITFTDGSWVVIPNTYNNVVRRGDLDGSGEVNSDDVTYLAKHLSSPEQYPLNQSGDFNGDGIVDDLDRQYLAYHCVFGDVLYPLSPDQISFEPGEVLMLADSEEEGGGDVLYKTAKACPILKKYGKNLFDPSKLLDTEGWKEENGYYVGRSFDVYQRFNPQNEGYMSLRGWDRASFSFYGYYEWDKDTEVNGLIAYFYYEDGTKDSVCVKSKQERFHQMHSNPNKKLDRMCFSYGTNPGIHHLRDIQLELGLTVTDYEAYREPTIHTADEKGTVDLVCDRDNMMLTADEGATLSTTYNLDLNRTIADLEQSISDLSAQILNI